MEKNRKILKISMIIIVTSLVLNIGVSFYFKLDKPVFLQSYMNRDIPIFDNGRYGDVEFFLRYITNANDMNVVNFIAFPEVPDLVGYADESGGHYFDFFQNQPIIPGRQVGTYSIRNIYVKIDAYKIPITDEEIKISKARVHLNNGETFDVDLGEIVLYGDKNSYDSYENFQYISGSSSTDGTSSTRLRVLKDIKLLKVDNPFLDKLKDLVDIRIDGINYDEVEEIEYGVGDVIEIDSKFIQADDVLRKFNDYNIHPRMNFIDSEGNPFIYRIYNIDYQNYDLGLLEIIKYLKARGEL